MKQSPPFRFKQFSVSHSRSSMKVGVDAVLVGALAPIEYCFRALDVGCGCGVISLMLEQRRPGVTVVGIDIDRPSVEEAAGNFLDSPWSEMLDVKQSSFEQERESVERGEIGKYDLIVSNPPFFRSGIDTPVTAREQARHQGTLSPEVLVRDSATMLTYHGRLTFICPADFREELEQVALRSRLVIESIVKIKGHASAPVKRLVMTLRRMEAGEERGEAPKEETLVLEVAPGVPTEEYRRLCKDFYLRF